MSSICKPESSMIAFGGLSYGEELESELCRCGSLRALVKAEWSD